MDAPRRCSRLGTRSAPKSLSAHHCSAVIPRAGTRGIRLPAMQAHQDPCEEVSDCVFCCPRPRTLRMLVMSAPPMHFRGSDPAHREERRNVEPVYSAMTDSPTANPGVSRSDSASSRASARCGSRRWAEHPHAPPSAMGGPVGGDAPGRRCRREGMPVASLRCATGRSRRHGDASVVDPRARHGVPHDESPVIRMPCPHGILRRTDPQAALTV